MAGQASIQRSDEHDTTRLDTTRHDTTRRLDTVRCNASSDLNSFEHNGPSEHIPVDVNLSDLVALS